MRKIILICSIVCLSMFVSCDQMVNITHQGTKYNDFEASKYRKIDKQNHPTSPKHKEEKEFVTDF